VVVRLRDLVLVLDPARAARPGQVLVTSLGAGDQALAN